MHLNSLYTQLFPQQVLVVYLQCLNPWKIISFSLWGCCKCPFPNYTGEPGGIQVDHLTFTCILLPMLRKTALSPLADQGQLLLPVWWLLSSSSAFLERRVRGILVVTITCCSMLCPLGNQDFQPWVIQSCRNRKHKITIVSSGIMFK